MPKSPDDFCNLNHTRSISFGVSKIGPGSKQPGPTERTENLRSSLVFRPSFLVSLVTLLLFMRTLTLLLFMRTLNDGAQMKAKQVYLFLCLAGLLLPYSQFIPWLAIHGLNGSVFLSQLFANTISAFFGMDVLVSAVVLFCFMRIENRRDPIPYSWAPIVATALVGVSLGLPLLIPLPA